MNVTYSDIQLIVWLSSRGCRQENRPALLKLIWSNFDCTQLTILIKKGVTNVQIIWSHFFTCFSTFWCCCKWREHTEINWIASFRFVTLHNLRCDKARINLQPALKSLSGWSQFTFFKLHKEFMHKFFIAAHTKYFLSLNKEQHSFEK